LDAKAEKELSTYASPDAQSTNEVSSANLDEIQLNPVPLRNLCPICFGKDSKRAHICFDGNFQLKTLKPRGEGSAELTDRDKRDKRLFVDAQLPATVVQDAPINGDETVVQDVQGNVAASISQDISKKVTSNPQ
jgi:hypothetical protein